MLKLLAAKNLSGKYPMVKQCYEDALTFANPKHRTLLHGAFAIALTIWLIIEWVFRKVCPCWWPPIIRCAVEAIQVNPQ